MRRLIIILSVCVYLLSVWVCTPPMLGFSLNSAVWTRVTYMFVHLSPVHLLLNLIAMYVLSGNLLTGQFIRKTPLMLFAVFGAFLATFGAEKELPTIGASGIVYFLVGAWVAKQRILTPGIAALCFIIALSNAVMGYFTNTNIIIHMLSALYGFVFMWVYKTIKSHGQKRKKKRD